MASTGQKLGRYELISLTSGERWLARQDGVDKRVEIRILSGADAEAQLAHAREIAQLEHANLGRVIDLGEDNGERYVVTEIVDGVTLAELLAVPQRLDELGLTRVLADACEGVDAAHESGDGLVHGGVTPSTIGILFSGQVKVSALDVTAPGPLAYCAPERLDGGTGDARSDVFSLGVVLWEALTHERLFDGSGEDATRKMVRELQIESPAMLNANVPAPLADACMKALAANPDVRYASAKLLAAELEAVLAQAGYSRRNEGIAKFVGEAFADRAAARKRKTTLPPEPAAIIAPVVVPEAAIAADAPAPQPIALFPRTTPLPIAMPSVIAPAAAAKPVQQTMTMPPPSVRPATASQPPLPVVHTMQMPATPEPPIVPTLSPAKGEPAKPVLPKPKASPTISPKPAKHEAAEELPTTRVERPTMEAVMTPPPPLAHVTPMTPMAPVLPPMRDPTPSPIHAVSLPDRPSSNDVIGGWGWKTDSMPALSDAGDGLDEPMPPPSRKPLMFVFGGALAVAALVSIVALASGGSQDPPAKPGAAKVAEPPTAAETPTPLPTATPIVAAATLPDDAAVAEPALSAPIDAEPPPDAAPPPPPDAAPPPIDAAPPDAPPPPKPVAVIPPPPPPPPKPRPAAIEKPKPAVKPVDAAQAAAEIGRRSKADRSVRQAGVRRRRRESLGSAAVRARRYRGCAVDAARLARIEPELRADLALARPHLPEARRARSGARRVQALSATRAWRRGCATDPRPPGSTRSMKMSRVTRTWLSAVLLAAGASAALADPHTALVLKTEGSADPAVRARVDAVVLRLAQQGGLAVTAGDITYGDAAAATGCKPEAASCRDDVMAMMSVDEIVSATTYVSGGELKVVVRRGGKGTPAREATATVAMIDNSDAGLEAGLGPLFGVTPTPAAKPLPAITQPTPTGELPATPTPTDHVTAAPDGELTAPALVPADALTSHHKLEVGGAIAGGVCVLLGFALWGAANSTENQIANAPSKTLPDLQHLQSLEQQGDGQANGGNFLFIAGLIGGGISGYYLYRDHRRASAAQHARITPVVVDHGAGIALIYGGSP